MSQVVDFVNQYIACDFMVGHKKVLIYWEVHVIRNTPNVSYACEIVLKKVSRNTLLK